MPLVSIPSARFVSGAHPSLFPGHGALDFWRDLATGLLGCATFGAAAAAGHGPLAMLTGAWAAPAVFVGGAALAAPPLYLSAALSGARLPAPEALAAVSRPLAAVATLLFGLAGPAAYLSVTLRTWLGPALLIGTALALGAAGVLSVCRAALARETGDAPKFAAALWCVFAFALGGRLVVAVAHAAGAGGGL